MAYGNTHSPLHLDTELNGDWLAQVQLTRIILPPDSAHSSPLHRTRAPATDTAPTLEK
ncbi:hypothetical protein SLEP1_g22731 [Rubroshorea leprosula]|uniref:Uncharacterized protein n=1 Tax=Rubroshorea leprosula TaxID=152421 RepID=A0AAV5JD28_9ROSI|nr:hypothetical protein SLEP1_g22731 [Rubroshorea leprosula]